MHKTSPRRPNMNPRRPYQAQNEPQTCRRAYLPTGVPADGPTCRRVHLPDGLTCRPAYLPTGLNLTGRQAI